MTMIGHRTGSDWKGIGWTLLGIGKIRSSSFLRPANHDDGHLRSLRTFDLGQCLPTQPVLTTGSRCRFVSRGK